MNAKPLLHTMIFSSLLAASFTAAAQDSSNNTPASGSAGANGSAGGSTSASANNSLGGSITAAITGSSDGAASGRANGSAAGSSSGSATGTATGASNSASNVPVSAADQLANRYAALAGSTEAAAQLVQSLRLGAETGVNMGFGDIDKALALAGALVAKNAAGDVYSALGTVMQMRAETMGWGAIAHQLGFKLNDVVNAAHGAAGNAQAAGNLGNSATAGIGDATSGISAATAGMANAGAVAGVVGTVGNSIGAQGNASASGDAKASKRIDVRPPSLTPIRPMGMGAPALPQAPQLPTLPRLPGL